MPVMRATNAPSTIGTWYVGVCESSRHDWPNPAPDFARVDSMVLSPPRPHPPMPGHSPIGTPIEPRVRGHKRADAQAATLDSSRPPQRRQVDRDLHAAIALRHPCTESRNLRPRAFPELRIGLAVLL